MWHICVGAISIFVHVAPIKCDLTICGSKCLIRSSQGKKQIINKPGHQKINKTSVVKVSNKCMIYSLTHAFRLQKKLHFRKPEPTPSDDVGVCKEIHYGFHFIMSSTCNLSISLTCTKHHHQGLNKYAARYGELFIASHLVSIIDPLFCVRCCIPHVLHTLGAE